VFNYTLRYCIMSIPDTDTLISGTRDDPLAIIRHSNGEDRALLCDRRKDLLGGDRSRKENQHTVCPENSCTGLSCRWSAKLFVLCGSFVCKDQMCLKGAIFQYFRVLSLLPLLTNPFPSGVNITPYTVPVCPFSLCTDWPVHTSHILTTPFLLPAATCFPSGLKVADLNSRQNSGLVKTFTEPSRMFQRRMVLSTAAERRNRPSCENSRQRTVLVWLPKTFHTDFLSVFHT